MSRTNDILSTMQPVGRVTSVKPLYYPRWQFWRWGKVRGYEHTAKVSDGDVAQKIKSLTIRGVSIDIMQYDDDWNHIILDEEPANGPHPDDHA